MQVERVKAKPVTFGIYLRTQKTKYGQHDVGLYKGKNIEIFHDYASKSKLYYISDSALNWVKYKFIYFHNGVKRVTKGESTNRFSKLI